MSAIRRFARGLIPPALAALARRLDPVSVRFSGAYPTWEAARAASDGYDSQLILDRVDRATQEVVRGNAAFERDSQAFDRPEFPFPVLAGLLRAAPSSQRLSILDFGGSLGSTYRQFRSFFPPTWTLDWRIVEQEHFVRRGRERYESEELRFFESIREAGACGPIDAVLVSGVLQCVERPYEALAELAELDSAHLIIDRHPMADIAEDRIAVQRAPAYIYPVSYPVWIFSRERFMRNVGRTWCVVAEFEDEEGPWLCGGVQFGLSGMILQKRAGPTP
jgi:putative methyltransferase (TIGR04325 family)